MKSIIIINSKFHKGTYLRVIEQPHVLITFMTGNVYFVTDEVAEALIENDEARIYQGSYYGIEYPVLKQVA